MKNAANNNLINCIACNQKRAPAKDDHRSQMCQACHDEIDAEMSKPLPALAGVPAGFRRNDFRGDI